VDQTTGLEYDAYLIEVRSIGGLSGSPVFVVFTTDRWLGDDAPSAYSQNRSFHLLGLVRGHWNKRVDETADFDEIELGPANLGIAIITPIADLTPVLDRKVFVDYANTLDKYYLETNAPIEGG
jgi:hypothetical protein